MPLTWHFPWGVGSILQNPPMSHSLRRAKPKGRRDGSQMRRGLLVRGMCLWDRAHLSAGVGRGTSHLGSSVPTIPGGPQPAVLYLPLLMDTRGGEMEVAPVPSPRAGLLAACTGN